jgi:hypothetical protein
MMELPVFGGEPPRFSHGASRGTFAAVGRSKTRWRCRGARRPRLVFAHQLPHCGGIAVKMIAGALGALIVAGLLWAPSAQARCYWDGILGWQCTPDNRPHAPPPACFPFWPFCS